MKVIQWMKDHPFPVIFKKGVLVAAKTMVACTKTGYDVVVNAKSTGKLMAY